MTRKESLSPEAKVEIISENLRTVARITRKHGVTVLLVGGMPLEAIFSGGRVNMLRDNGTIRDVDGLGMGPDKQTIDACNEEIIRTSAGKKLFPPVGIEPACFGDRLPLDHPWILLSGIRVDAQKRTYLYYGKIEEEIPRVTMQPVQIQINGTEFDTLPKTTLLWRYYVRSGLIKPKDKAKVDRLREYISQNQNGEPDSANYEPYRRFVERVSENYPGRLWADRVFWDADYKLGGVFSGSLWLYGLIGLFRKT